jgi:hypothetical protein
MNGVRLEARPTDDSQEWTEIFPAQLEWVVKQGHKVRAADVALMEPYERKAIEELVLNIRAMAKLISSKKQEPTAVGDHGRKLMILAEIVEGWLEKVDGKAEAPQH